ncbi:MAG TPA: phytoene desaturase family protein [Gemmatales bacterium]|nr:phytoene desaturase family protein [Gemmatales bacterium]
MIGAGPGGLAAALLLAHRGYDVTILEKQPFVGGRTSTLSVEGFHFDRGPTFFLYPRVLADIFSAIGRDLATDVPMVRLDPQYRLIFGGGGELLCTPDLERMEKAIAALSPEDAPQFRRFLDENRDKLARFRPILEMPFLGFRDLLRPAVLRALPKLRPWNSVDDDLRRCFRDPRIRLALSFQSKYLGMSPFQCPSLFTILSFLEYEHGVHHPIGGCGAVSQRMAEIATQMGVQIKLGAGATGLEFQGRRVTAVHTATDRFPCDALVVNADFAQAMNRLVPDHLRRRWSDAQLERKRYSCSTFMLYLGIEGRYDHLSHHTIYLSQDYLGNIDDIENRHVLSADPSLYVQNPCVTDDSLAPPGQSTLYVLAPVTHQHPNVDWDQEKERFRAVVFSQLARLGLSDLPGRIRVERVVTPADWEERFFIYRGATFNLAHNLGQMLLGRPRNRFEELDGVYLVGGGTHPGSGLPVIYESARITSRLVAEDLGAPRSADGPPPQRPTVLAGSGR